MIVLLEWPENRASHGAGVAEASTNPVLAWRRR
jgi:hypothetical protein